MHKKKNREVNFVYAKKDKLNPQAFKEINPPLSFEQAFAEANRCLYCYNAPCANACPTHIDIAKFIKQIANRNIEGAKKTILEANIFGLSCGIVCPTEVLCEGACVHNLDHKKPIAIGLLQRYAVENASVEFEFEPLNGKTVAVIGAGPAGLSAAFYLRRLGFSVTVYEKRDFLGGLNTSGIAEYKMTKEVALLDVEIIKKSDIDIRLNVEVGKDISFEDLLKNFDAVFIGVGLSKTADLKISGENLKGVLDAIDFIEKIKFRRYDELDIGDVVCVIGGGNTAIDCATQAKRLGAGKVMILYRRDIESLPCYKYEYEIALNDGIEFIFQVVPKSINGKKRVESITLLKTELGEKDASGKRSFKIIEGSDFTIKCDSIIKALGQVAYNLSKFNIETNSDGTIKVNEKLQTSIPKVFAGGDAINGGKEVVNAVADGKKAAYEIYRFLIGDKIPPAQRYWVSTIDASHIRPIEIYYT
ncbi:MAG: NAD(P)-dependent oxidoreductase [bacterium]|nr:NAD(P)-dependent oxidoreductase [bacterium]